MAAASGTGHLVEDFDGAFQNCLSAIMRQEHFNINDPEETKCSVEQCIQRFFDIAKQLEIFFLQKRMLLSAQKPEQVIKEDINELKLELQRKEQLIHRHYEKVQQWQTILNRTSAAGLGQSQPSQGTGLPAQQPATSQGQSPATQPSPAAPSTPQPQPPPVTTIPQPHPPPKHHPQPHPTHPQLQTQHSQPGHPHGMMGPIGSLPQPPQLQQQAQFPQGPLAYLEQTTSNIGLPERH